MIAEQIAASRCPRCDMLVAPPSTYCPHHPVLMQPVTLPGVGEVVSFTTLHTPPQGFRSPLHLALVELDGGARFVCHGADVRGLRIGAAVAIEAIDDIYYFSQAGLEGEGSCRELTVRCPECACWTSPGCWPGRSAR